MTKLVGKNLFLYEIKQNHHLLYGKNFAEEIQINQPNFSEKLTCFVFPSIVLFLYCQAYFFLVALSKSGVLRQSNIII